MDQRIDLSGDWKINISQEIKGQNLNFTLLCTLSQIGDQVIGLMVFDIDRIDYQFTSVLKDDRKYDIQLQGEIRGGQLKMQYTNIQRDIHQFGYLISTIESNSRMNGLFIGFGPEAGGLISGSVEFWRQ